MGNSWRALAADAVIPLTYAGPGTQQARQDLRQYKDGWSTEIRESAVFRLSFLVWHFSTFHGACCRAVHGWPDALAFVPSGKAVGRAGGHPLIGLNYFQPLPQVGITRLVDAPPREIDPATLSVDTDVDGMNVLLYDDTWTSGASSQTAAIALRRAGAAKVVVIVLGRWLNGEWGPTKTLMNNHPPLPWSPDICPVTGGGCPSA